MSLARCPGAVARSPPIWTASLAEDHTVDELLEPVVVTGWFRLVSSVINGCRMPLESWAGAFSS